MFINLHTVETLGDRVAVRLDMKASLSSLQYFLI